MNNKYDFKVEFIQLASTNYKVGFRIYAEPKLSGYQYAAWADTKGADFACTEGTRSANIEAAKKISDHDAVFSEITQHLPLHFPLNPQTNPVCGLIVRMCESHYNQSFFLPTEPRFDAAFRVLP